MRVEIVTFNIVSFHLCFCSKFFKIVWFLIYFICGRTTERNSYFGLKFITKETLGKSTEILLNFRINLYWKHFIFYLAWSCSIHPIKSHLLYFLPNKATISEIPASQLKSIKYSLSTLMLVSGWRDFFFKFQHYNKNSWIYTDWQFLK